MVNKLYEQLMAMDIKEIEALIKEALPDAVIEIQDLEIGRASCRERV